MPKDIQIVAGLGNPGPRYVRSRHNAGFMLVDFVRESAQSAAPWKSWRGAGDYCAAVTPSGREFLLVRPLTFMNDSGRMTGDFCRFHRVPPEGVLVCFDDVSLELGRIRIKQKGSSGGQKGMESVINTFPGQDIPRLRLGIGPRPPHFSCSDFVLSPFTAAELKLFRPALEKGRDAVFMAVESGIQPAMDRFNPDS